MLVFLFLCPCVLVNVATKEMPEPTCYSRFDYDEKMLLKLLRVQEEVGTFRTFVSELKNRQEEEDRKREESVQAFLQNAKTKLDIEVEKYQSMIEDIRGVRQETIDKTQTAVDEIKLDLRTLKNAISSTVAFTVKKPSDAANNLVFTEIVTNEGGGYDTATGRFTCTVPGWYYFIAHLVKLRQYKRVDSTGCTIDKNSITLVKLYINPQDSGADIGSYGVGNSVFVHLNEGDVVSTGKIRSASTMDDQSSFSGFLVRST